MCRAKGAPGSTSRTTSPSRTSQAHQENIRSVEHLKRYTTLGMATDQGKTANVTALAIMAEQTGKSIPETGTTVFRPPYTPVSLAGARRRRHRTAFPSSAADADPSMGRDAGRGFHRSGPMDAGPVFSEARRNPLASERRREEAKAVRSGVGVCDVTTLGKIDMQGKDAAAFLGHVYANMLGHAAGGQGPLRPDAARGRNRL